MDKRILAVVAGLMIAGLLIVFQPWEVSAPVTTTPASNYPVIDFEDAVPTRRVPPAVNPVPDAAPTAITGSNDPAIPEPVVEPEPEMMSPVSGGIPPSSPEAVQRRRLANAAYVDGRYQEAFEGFLPLAQGGDSSVMYTLGLMYERGQGTATSAAQARRWFRAAAESGDARGMNEFGSMYATGEGVGRNDARAVEWWRKAADKGNLSAMLNLAQMYERGLGVERSIPQAIAWNEKAAEQGNPQAEANLARLRK